MIVPHGNKLINRLCTPSEANQIQTEIPQLKSIKLNEQEETDLMMIADGAFSPLEGFMVRDQYESVLEDMRLPNGLAWSMPITLQISQKQVQQFRKEKKIALVNDQDEIIGILYPEDFFQIAPQEEAQQIYGTTDSKHPSVSYLLQRPEWAIGGKVKVLDLQYRFIDYPDLYQTPEKLRQKIQDLGWNSVVAFQTRNPIHRAHEYLQKCALEMVDGLLLHPLMGKTKDDDIPGNIRMECYQALLKGYYPKDRVHLSIYPAYMRYAGPREAILHAIVRQNYGCSHIIIGRDHAGVGSYYGTYDAQKIFDQLEISSLAITPLKFEHTFYCSTCVSMASSKTCPHPKENHVFLSGTKVREMLQKGEMPPVEFTRPEIAQILIASMKKAKNITKHFGFVSKQEREDNNHHKGVVIWFTGLPASGKSTVATHLEKALFERNCQTYILDGDNIRHGLNKNLGFSPTDRQENIRRIGEVANLFADAGLITLTAFISPYQKDRDQARETIGNENFLEVYVDCPLNECEKRDPKGLYKKARDGIIPDFTGVSAPYEAPTKPEIHLHADQYSPEELTDQVLSYLKEYNIIK